MFCFSTKNTSFEFLLSLIPKTSSIAKFGAAFVTFSDSEEGKLMEMIQTTPAIVYQMLTK